jgi:gamma-glutamyltranspeptidase/glutathione hydrolase
MDERRPFPLPGSNAIEVKESLRPVVTEAFCRVRAGGVQSPPWPVGGAQAIAIDCPAACLSVG